MAEGQAPGRTDLLPHDGLVSGEALLSLELDVRHVLKRFHVADNLRAPACLLSMRSHALAGPSTGPAIMLS
jgi:hypothetical protein